MEPARLEAFELSASDVSAALTAANVLASVVFVDEHSRLYLIISDSLTRTLDAFRELPVKTTSKGVIELGDVATVEHGTQPQFTHSTADGRDCALLNVYQQPGGNTVQTALLLYMLGQSFNIKTLGGMAAAVGLIIDDAIIISEHIIRRIESDSPGERQSLSVRDRVLTATSEFTRPLAGSSLSTIIILIPPAFLVGVFGAFFGALSLSMAPSRRAVRSAAR